MYFRPCSANWDRKPGDPADYCYGEGNLQRFIIIFDSDSGDAGRYCYSPTSCASRARNLTSSAGLPFSSWVDGLLLPYPEVSPNLYKAHAAYIPYCTSDLYLGASPAGGGLPAFAGRAVFDAVWAALLARTATPRLIDADQILVVGPLGVVLRLGEVRAALAGAAGAAGLPPPALFGLLDGGLLPSLPPFDAGAARCAGDGDCPPRTGLAAGAAAWGLSGASAPAFLSSWCPAAAGGRPEECLMDAPPTGAAARGLDTPLLLAMQQQDAALLRALGAWPAALTNGTPAAAWAQAQLAPALTAAAAPAPATFAAACAEPSALAASPATFNLAVRRVDAYNHTQLHPLAVAVSTLLDDPLSAFGTFADNCKGALCNAAACRVQDEVAVDMAGKA